MKIFLLRRRSIFACGLLFSLVLACGSAGYLRRIQPAEAVATQARSLPIYAVETEEKVAALGINCAWDNEDIPALLAALDAAQVKATFFILGQWAEKYPESVRAIATAGHELASHSYTHRDLTSLSAAEIAEEACRSMKAIGAVGGNAPTLLRPPSGAYNNLVIDTINSLGYTPIQWDVDTLDWQKLTVDEMLLRVTTRTKPGSILLLHSGALHTAEALPGILRVLAESDFALKPVGALLYPKPYSIDTQGRQHR